MFLINHIDTQYVTEQSFYTDIINGHVNSLGAVWRHISRRLLVYHVMKTNNCTIVYCILFSIMYYIVLILP